MELAIGLVFVGLGLAIALMYRLEEFIKEWRLMVKTGRFKPIEIGNSALLCQHGRVAHYTEDEYDEKFIYIKKLI